MWAAWSTQISFGYIHEGIREKSKCIVSGAHPRRAASSLQLWSVIIMVSWSPIPKCSWLFEDRCVPRQPMCLGLLLPERSLVPVRSWRSWRVLHQEVNSTSAFEDMHLTVSKCQLEHTPKVYTRQNWLTSTVVLTGMRRNSVRNLCHIRNGTVFLHSKMCIWRATSAS